MGKSTNLCKITVKMLIDEIFEYYFTKCKQKTAYRHTEKALLYKHKVSHAGEISTKQKRVRCKNRTLWIVSPKDYFKCFVLTLRVVGTSTGRLNSFREYEVTIRWAAADSIGVIVAKKLGTSASAESP